MSERIVDHSSGTETFWSLEDNRRFTSASGPSQPKKKKKNKKISWCNQEVEETEEWKPYYDISDSDSNRGYSKRPAELCSPQSQSSHHSHENLSHLGRSSDSRRIGEKQEPNMTSSKNSNPSALNAIFLTCRMHTVSDRLSSGEYCLG